MGIGKYFRQNVVVVIGRVRARRRFREVRSSLCEAVVVGRHIPAMGIAARAFVGRRIDSPGRQV